MPSNPRPVSGGGKSGASNTAYTMQRRLSSMKSHEFTLRSNFDKLGYRNREDITILPGGILVVGSYNVLTNTGGRIGVTKGYTLDGQANTTITPITSSYDFTKVLSNDRHVRSYQAKLQFRYVRPVTNAVEWTDLASGLSSTDFNYSPYFDTTELTTVLLFVNGTPNIYEWSGGVVSLASVTSTTITKQGTSTWAQEGFYTAGTRRVVIGGIAYTYTGGENTTTLTGVTPDPTLGSHVAGDAVFQQIRTTANSAITGLPAAFNNALIGNLSNQIFIGARNSSVIYTSKVNNYKDYSSSSPRLQGDGNNSTIADYPTAFVNQEDSLYVSAGKDLWYRTELVNTTTSVYDTTTMQTVSTVYQILLYQQLKTASLQAAQSQAATTKIKNDIVFLSFEPIVNSLGRVEDVLLTPQVTDLSYSIVNDMNSYDLTDASMIYFRQFLYISVPKEGIIRIYNMSNQDIDQNGNSFQYWEAPVTYPIARFSIIGDELYGHGYAIPETYKLFDGYDFNGHPIPAVALFSFEQYGTRTYPKVFNMYYLEGYITSNCQLNYGFNYDIDGCATQRIFDIVGNDKRLVCSRYPDASLGKANFGKRPLSGLILGGGNTSPTGLPPKFRAIKQLSELPFYELQPFFQSQGSSQQWELVAFGTNARPASEGNNSRQY